MSVERRACAAAAAQRQYVMPRAQPVPMVSLDYAPPRPGRWRWPGWPLALVWLSCCLCGASAGAYAATLVFWGEFRPEAWHVVPSRVIVGAGVSAALTSAVLVLARLQPWAKISIWFAGAACLTVLVTLYALMDLWGP